MRFIVITYCLVANMKWHFVAGMLLAADWSASHNSSANALNMFCILPTRYLTPWTYFLGCHSLYLGQSNIDYEQNFIKHDEN